ncbi:hypothetical protein QJQ45_023519 [Haematococcus lacustris]|nr:hypothetical protein QJQ45_023519 [Haematococcus lacustris]
MEAVREETSGQLSEDFALRASLRSTPPFQQRSRQSTRNEQPSIKYKEIETLSPSRLQRAQSPPKPTLPRRQVIRTWQATAKERNPLASSLTGPGRAGKYGELQGDSGGRYEGEVLAGRPHGSGRYLLPKNDGSDHMVVQYEGDWVQVGLAVRGRAVHLVANIRHGEGRYMFANGDMYAGQWVDDRRTGRGIYFSANGDIFVGSFIRDRKEGMGTLYMINRQRKYVAEYLNGAPQCGTVLQLEDQDLEPLRGQLAGLALTQKLELAAAGQTPAALPELQLEQPNKVLGAQVVAVRRQRATSTNAAMRSVQANSGTLSDKDLEMLRHSFTLMAAGDSPSVGLLPHQLRELCVMAGLDPAAEATRLLVAALVARKEAGSGRISFDSCMKVALHFREKSEVDLALEREEEEALAAHCASLAATQRMHSGLEEASSQAEEGLGPAAAEQPHTGLEGEEYEGEEQGGGVAGDWGEGQGEGAAGEEGHGQVDSQPAVQQADEAQGGLRAAAEKSMEAGQG